MKTPSRTRHPQDTLQTALRSAFPIDARRLAVLSALVLAILQAQTVVLYALKTHVHLPGTLDTRYQRLLRFVQFEFPDACFARFALSFLPAGDLWLILDRTNWKLGSQDVNILLLSAVWNGFSLPLMWTLIPHSGNSNSATRQALVERFQAACPERKVSGLLADREFIGKAWFTFLKQQGIAPCIRLRADTMVGDMPVWACFKSLQHSEFRIWHRPLVVYGVKLRVLGTKNAAGETLFLAYQGRGAKNLARYSLRWQAENLHSALKTRGFNLEDTGLTRAERISTLLTAVSISFIWACVTGEFLARLSPIRKKSHGYGEVSVFRLGLDRLQDLLLHPSIASWRVLAKLMPRFEG